MYICPFFFVFKHLVIVLFVVAVLLQSGFVAMHAVYQIQVHKRQVKLEMKRQIKAGKHNAVLSGFSEKDLQSAEWEHSREFFLNGSKYDLVRTEKVNGETIFWCINDSRELELFNALDKEQNKQSVLNDVFKKLSLGMSGFGSATLPHRLVFECLYPNWENTYQYSWNFELLRPPAMA